VAWETRKSHYQAVSSLCLAAIQCHRADRPINQMVYFCLLESLEVGGHALKLSDCYVVTIYAGAFERLRRLFLALVNHNEIRTAMTATSAGKRCQALGGAKNHMVVMPDADIDQAVDALMGAAYGSAGERCMAISVAVPIGERTAEALISKLEPKIRDLKVGSGFNSESEWGRW